METCCAGISVIFSTIVTGFGRTDFGLVLALRTGTSGITTVSTFLTVLLAAFLTTFFFTGVAVANLCLSSKERHRIAFIFLALPNRH